MKNIDISVKNGCIASKKIFDENYKVGYMMREAPSNNFPDSGWRFFVGNENENFTQNSENFKIYMIETIIKHDQNIEKYLNNPIGSKFIRINEFEFKKDDENTEIYISKIVLP